MRGLQSRNLVYLGISVLVVIATSACTDPKNRPSNTTDESESKSTVAKAAISPQVHEEKLEACYLTFLKSNPSPDEGIILVSWELNKNGEVRGTKLMQSDLKDKHFNNCVIENVKSASFPTSANYPKTVGHKFSFKRRTPAGL